MCFRLHLLVQLTILIASTSSSSFAEPSSPKPPPGERERGSVEYWQEALKGKTKQQVKVELGTPTAIDDRGSVYIYKEDFFHPDLDQWRDLLIRFSEADDFVESFTGSGKDTKTYPVSVPTADELAPPTPTPTPTPIGDELKRRIEKSIVTIEYSESSRQGEGAGGTGFIVEHDGRKYVATNIHVLEGETDAQVRLAWHHGPRPGPSSNPRLVQKSRVKTSFQEFAKEIIRLPMPVARALDGTPVHLGTELLLSSERDIALIPAKTTAPALKISKKPPTRESQCIVVGDPEAARTLLVLDGEISQLGPDRIELDRFRGGKLKPGMSGSPVVESESGEVIGIIAYLTRRKEWKDDVIVPGAFGASVVRVMEENVRNFAYRLDNVNDLVSHNWRDFVRDCLMLVAMEERTANVYWASRAYSVVSGKDQDYKLTPDFDNSVSVLYDSFVSDLRQINNLRDRARILSMWQGYQRRLELSLHNDLNNSQFRVITPWFTKLVATDITAARRFVSAKLREQAGQIQSPDARR